MWGKAIFNFANEWFGGINGEGQHLGLCACWLLAGVNLESTQTAGAGGAVAHDLLVHLYVGHKVLVCLSLDWSLNQSPIQGLGQGHGVEILRHFRNPIKGTHLQIAAFSSEESQIDQSNIKYLI